MKFEECKEVVDFGLQTGDIDRLCDVFDKQNMWSSLMGSRKPEVLPEGFFKSPSDKEHFFDEIAKKNNFEIESDSVSAFGCLVRNMALIIEAGGRDAYIAKKRQEQADSYSEGSFLKI